MLGRPLSGSRTWMWQMAAPASAAPIQASAISCGVTGSAGFCARVGKLPVTAQVKMVGFMTLPRDSMTYRKCWTCRSDAIEPRVCRTAPRTAGKEVTVMMSGGTPELRDSTADDAAASRVSDHDLPGTDRHRPGSGGAGQNHYAILSEGRRCERCRNSSATTIMRLSTFAAIAQKN